MILGHKNTVYEFKELGQDAFLKKHGLGGWLQIAAESLEAAAADRISQEIKSHFTDAVATYLAKGQSETSAQSTALADLGDPQRAGSKFRNDHLTLSDVKWLATLERIASMPLFSIRALPYEVSLLAGIILLSYSPQWLVRFPLWIFILFVSYAGFRLAPRLLNTSVSGRNFERLIGLTGGLTGLACGLIIGLSMTEHMHDKWNDPWDLFFDIYWMLYLGYFFNPGIRIWRKLRKMPDPWLNPPPQQPVSS